MRFLQFLTMLGAAVVFAACGGGTSTGTTRPGGGSPAASAAGGEAVACTGSGGQAVSITNFAYSPPSTTVAVGGTATWTNNDSAAHTVTFDASNLECGGELATGETATAQFTSAGSFAYHCRIHPNMKGTVVVQ